MQAYSALNGEPVALFAEEASLSGFQARAEGKGQLNFRTGVVQSFQNQARCCRWGCTHASDALKPPLGVPICYPAAIKHETLSK